MKIVNKSKSYLIIALSIKCERASSFSGAHRTARTPGQMTRHSIKHVAGMHADPFLAPSFALSHRARRSIWSIVYWLLFRFSPRPCHAWRALLLRAFGAMLGKNCRIYPTARIWAPWTLECADVVTIGDEAIVYNPSPIRIGSHAVISQQAYLCGASHDYDDPAFTMISAPIEIGARAWICARATVQMGVSIGEGAVLGLGSVATGDLEAWAVYAGVPARRLKTRIGRPIPNRTIPT